MPADDLASRAPARVRVRDIVRVAWVGVASRRPRAVLAALGIGIGVGAIVGVIGLGTSSRAAVAAAFDRLGSNLLTVAPGADLAGPRPFPAAAPTAVAGIDGVTDVSYRGSVEGVTVRRSPFVPIADTSGISVVGVDAGLPRTLGTSVASGRWLDAATSRTPTVVLGATSAERLSLGPGDLAYIGGRWFTVAGVLRPVVLDASLDTAALVGAAYVDREPFAAPFRVSRIDLRTRGGTLDRVRGLVGATVDPASPGSALVSRPTDSLRAEAVTSSALDGLVVGLGAIALLIGGVGIANVMVVAVLERRGEIGLRRALGAVRPVIAGQFLVEALILSLLGAVGGILLGAATVTVVSLARGWTPMLPVGAAGAAAAASIGIGLLAGALPALRAARLTPTEALRTE